MEQSGPNGQNSNGMDRIRTNGLNRTKEDRMDRIEEIWTK